MTVDILFLMLLPESSRFTFAFPFQVMCVQPSYGVKKKTYNVLLYKFLTIWFLLAFQNLNAHLLSIALLFVSWIWETVTISFICDFIASFRFKKKKFGTWIPGNKINCFKGFSIGVQLLPSYAISKVWKRIKCHTLSRYI